MPSLSALSLRLLAFFLSFGAYGASSQNNSTAAFPAIFNTAGIVPTVIPAFSGGVLEVQFPNFSAPFTIGQGFNKEQTIGVPSFALAQELVPQLLNETLVIIMVDPDAPNPQNNASSDVRHFVGPNFVLDESGTLTNMTPALSEFRDPSPPALSTGHRYTLFAFVQPDGFVDAATPIIANSTSVANFNFISFIAATGLGDPIAGTFFLTGSDDQPAHTTAGAQSGFETAGIVPNVLPSFDPVAILDLSYPNINGSNFLIRMNENMSVSSVAPAPEIFLSFNDTSLANETFVLITVDPDAPTPQNTSSSDFLHVLIADVEVTGPLNAFAPLSNTTALAPYLSPAPPVGSDPHRYVWLLFVQPEGFVDAATPLIPPTRANFNFTAFREVTGLGDPVAGTFFRSGLNATLGA